MKASIYDFTFTLTLVYLFAMPFTLYLVYLFHVNGIILSPDRKMAWLLLETWRESSPITYWFSLILGVVPTNTLMLIHYLLTRGKDHDRT